MIIMKGWYGRLGNNIIQLSNIIDIAIIYKHNLSLTKCNSPFFDLDIITNYFNKYNNDEIITHRLCFFGNPYSVPLSQLSDDEKSKLLEEKCNILKDAFKIKDIEKLNENYLVVHIRGGDLFLTAKPPEAYVPPPLSYYTDHIDKHNYEKIIIVAEDKYNPVVHKLLEMYENSTWSKNNLETDIRILLGATNVLYSVGTFVPSLMMVSNNIKNIYKPNCEELEDYYNFMKPWKNTIEQRNFITTYNCNSKNIKNEEIKNEKIKNEKIKNKKISFILK